MYEWIAKLQRVRVRACACVYTRARERTTGWVIVSLAGWPGGWVDRCILDIQGAGRSYAYSNSKRIFSVSLPSPSPSFSFSLSFAFFNF